MQLLESWLHDDAITHIWIYSPQKIFYERQGRRESAKSYFRDETDLLNQVNELLTDGDTRLNNLSPFIDLRLKNGWHILGAVDPVVVGGPTIIFKRTVSRSALTMKDLFRLGTITPEIAEFLRGCVIANLNIVISGGTGAGKTTLLNILAELIPQDSSVVSLEYRPELSLPHEHWIQLISPAPYKSSRMVIEIDQGSHQDIHIRTPENVTNITMSHLLLSAQGMFMDRLIVDELRGGETLDLLQAMNRGRGGTMATLCSLNPRSTLARLEVMSLMAGLDTPMRAIREQIASAVDLIVHIDRLRDGQRKIVKITEVRAMEGEIIDLADIFEFEQTAIERGAVIGKIRPTGVRPDCLERIENAGIHLPLMIFGLNTRY